MNATPSHPLLWILPLVLLGGLSCGGPAAEDNAPAKQDGGGAQNDAPDSDPQQAEGDAAPVKQKVCDVITFADLNGITGAVYKSTESQADYPNIKHCGYFSEDIKHSISLTVAFGTTAGQRMEQSKATPGMMPLADFGDEAVWHPKVGTLTAKFGERCVEIRISQAHGDEQTRLGFAKQIVNLAMERFDEPG